MESGVRRGKRVTSVWRDERSQRLTVMLVAGEILPCEVREVVGKWPRWSASRASESQRARRKREQCARILQRRQVHDVTQGAVEIAPRRRGRPRKIIPIQPEHENFSPARSLCDKANCVDCREIFGNEKCRWGIL
jgi:hypothetical protein